MIYDLHFQREHAGCRINDAAAKVLTAEVRQPSAGKITFGQRFVMPARVRAHPGETA